MADLEELRERLHTLDGEGYGAYKRIKGSYRGADGMVLHIDHVQGDPFARPSRLRAAVPAALARLPREAFSSRDRRRATADFLNRRLYEAFAGAPEVGGSGRSGELQILRPSQAVLERTSLLASADGDMEVRFGAGLPARGRRILGDAAARLLIEVVPACLRAALLLDEATRSALDEHIRTVEDAVSARSQLAGRGLVAFVAEGASLPRRSGVDDRPLHAGAVSFRVPEPLRCTLEVPNAGTLTGMGVPEGVTLIVGGGYHGKSTLLRAIESGIYDRIPGDGRERVVAVATAMKVRAEDGRSVRSVDISNFIGELPGGQATAAFRTENASGSTSQAATIMEAVECGATALLLDEDTSATNFLIRDARMQALVADRDEPITPLIDRVRALYDQQGISTILVVGGSGDYFDVADHVIGMRAYLAEDRTAEAKRIADEQPSARAVEGGVWRAPPPRLPLPDSVQPGRGRRDRYVRVNGLSLLELGRERLDTGSLEQLVESAQLEAMAQALIQLGSRFDADTALAELLHRLGRDIEHKGLDVISESPIGDYAGFRPLDLAGVLNRLRSLRIRVAPD